MKIKFCGAASSVTGSCHLITSGELKVLLDCGQFQGSKAQEAMNFEPFPFDPTEIDFVILSHAHIDHCGRLPLLVKRGFTGKIYCTDATADLLKVMLLDSAYIHEKEAEWKNRKAERAGRELTEPLYTIKDAEIALEYIEEVLYDQLIEPNEQVHFVFNDAGHILGSAIIELWVTEENKTSKIVFSGDLGVPNRPLLRDPIKIKKADYVIMESTYGNRIHESNESSLDRLIAIILTTIERDGTVVIPSFAVGRTQELIFEFGRFYEDHPELHSTLDRAMVYIDSPMATSATEVFRKNAQVFNDETKEFILSGDNPLEFKNLKFTRTTEESQQLNENKAPKIIISASGMCEAGRIRHHLKHHLWNPSSSIVFVGYQGEGTLGRRILEGAKTVTLFGEEIYVNAEVYNLEGFSAHADKYGLLDWLHGFQKKPYNIFLVHGEEDSKNALAESIRSELDFDTTVIAGISEYELKPEVTVTKEEAVRDYIDQEQLYDIKDTIAGVHEDLETILYNTQLLIGENISAEQIAKINNLVLELEKTAINLGSAINQDEEEQL